MAFLWNRQTLLDDPFLCSSVSIDQSILEETRYYLGRYCQSKTKEVGLLLVLRNIIISNIKAGFDSIIQVIISIISTNVICMGYFAQSSTNLMMARTINSFLVRQDLMLLS